VHEIQHPAQDAASREIDICFSVICMPSKIRQNHRDRREFRVVGKHLAELAALARLWVVR